MKHKPEYEIIKTRFEVEREKIKAKLDSECPECHYYDIWNGMFSDAEYDYYTCKRCGAEWRILREDYKNRKSRMQKEFLLTLMATLFAIALVITYVLSNFK